MKILINCTKPTNKIVLNWDDLNITESDVKLTTTQLINPHEANDTVDVRLLKSDESENVEYNTENITTVTTTEEPIVIETKIIPMLVQDIVFDEENFKMNIISRNLLEAGHTYTIDIKFKGVIENNLVGLYKTKYVDLQGNTRWLATTHFQAVYARRVFPCFDEPSFKASFEISIARRTNMTAISNMPLKSTEPM